MTLPQGGWPNVEPARHQSRIGSAYRDLGGHRAAAATVRRPRALAGVLLEASGVGPKSTESTGLAGSCAPQLVVDAASVGTRLRSPHSPRSLTVRFLARPPLTSPSSSGSHPTKRPCWRRPKQRGRGSSITTASSETMAGGRTAPSVALVLKGPASGCRRSVEAALATLPVGAGRRASRSRSWASGAYDGWAQSLRWGPPHRIFDVAALGFVLARPLAPPKRTGSEPSSEHIDGAGTERRGPAPRGPGAPRPSVTTGCLGHA